MLVFLISFRNLVTRPGFEDFAIVNNVLFYLDFDARNIPRSVSPECPFLDLGIVLRWYLSSGAKNILLEMSPRNAFPFLYLWNRPPIVL